MNLTIHALKLDDETFERIVKANPEWNFEQTAAGEIVIVPPTGGTSGEKNLNLSMQFGNWVENNLELGRGFDSSTLFILPNSAKRIPDVSWVRLERWDALSRKQRDGYVPLCPDFVIELRSPTDNLEDLRAKMREYMDNGARLGWLINQASFPGEASPGNVAPRDGQVEILISTGSGSGQSLSNGE